MPDLRRLERMVEMLSLIDRGETVTPKSLAAHFGVAERTIYRDMGILSIDFPVSFDEEKGSYRFTEGYSLKKIDLSKDELRALLVSKAFLSKMGEGVSNAYGSLIKKLNAEMSAKSGQRLKSTTQNYWFDIDPVDNFASVKKQFDSVQKALDEKISLEITYRRMQRDKQETVRVIDPYGLFFSSGVWYVLAYCRLRKAVRVFALDCIKRIKETGNSYTIPPDFSMDEYFKAGWHMIRYGDPVEVKLRFSKDTAPWITRKKWHPTQKIEKNKDGSIIFSVTLKGTKELRWWVYHWGTNCEVISPPEFRKEVLAELKAMVEVYEGK